MEIYSRLGYLYQLCTAPPYLTFVHSSKSVGGVPQSRCFPLRIPYVSTIFKRLPAGYTPTPSLEIKMDGHEAIYQYPPIVSNEEIRVLRLEPGAFAQPLIGSLVVRKIGDDEENPPAYDCMSYCWGPQEHFTLLTCDGQALRITLAVDGMLRHLRKPTKPRHLWIDASMC
jgi:hypothetical protein